MTKLSKYHELVSQLDKDNVVAIIGLIDLKTEEDMDKVLNKLDAMDQKFEARLDAMDQKFEAKFDAMDHKISSIKWWLVSIATISLGIIVAFLRLFPQVLV